MYSIHTLSSSIKISFTCKFFAFTPPKPFITTIQCPKDIKKIKQQLSTRVLPSNTMFNLEITGHVIWNKQEYSFDERHADKAIQVKINHCKYLMYEEVRSSFKIFEVCDSPDIPTCIVGFC